MTGLRLLSFVPADFDALAGWFASPEEAVLWGGPQVAWPLTAVQFTAMLAEGDMVPPQRRCWSAWRGDAMVGHGQAVYDWAAGRARLARIAIAPARRGEGLGGSMLDALLRELFADPAIGRVDLNVYTHNRRAIALYTRLGFVPGAITPGAVRIDGQAWDGMTMTISREDHGAKLI
ncbi:GNAT family N-acetyltransferase [Sphingomonas histidinilytica]|uniref:Protein N-acetyltransferase, RimJ/RimL family n=1 Tax=Rhizorhabdus histidinilytica TaxID=439228 RepID=A0A1T5GPL7_9SPHN|nr:GNAT family protein [Rhizorhabdus histidinilytica]MBO9380357.1 GNAT family N-acetyltransferase [Rhizorhabdus histidinilytica]QEH77020.1 GNAT family N-acetyltransferase [Sphingomonas sp. C8-2]SKC10321.1 Protein N-acetyltransferase, RimJ/RimL family [Rhizorhabdus histidinilytica]